MSQRLRHALAEGERLVREYLLQPQFRRWFGHEDLEDGAYAYLERPAKRLRPVVLLLACRAVGGAETKALPAAASVEMYHTWTLVHDDLIDNDDVRRNGATVHAMFSVRARQRVETGGDWAQQYGRDLAVLVGDSQHGWAIWLLLQTAMESPELAPTVLKLGQFLESSLLNMLIRGEILDVQFTGCPVLNLARTQILDMLYLKTGALYEYAALAGAAIGLGSTDWEHPWIRGLAQFASRCGTAFQLQDDILGLTGTDEIIGKPVGSDVREGKRTTITYCAYHRANASQRRRLDRILGNRAATPAEVAEAVDLLRDLGGIQETAELARQLTEQAIPLLDAIPESDARELLAEWAQFLIERRF